MRQNLEALLANFLDQRFNNPQEVLNSFCEHVHMALEDLNGKPKGFH